MVLSMGPQHPSTHGVLQVMTKIEGEAITSADPEIGYLHTGIEKSAENLFWSQAQTVIERMDYLAPLSKRSATCLRWNSCSGSPARSRRALSRCGCSSPS